MISEAPGQPLLAEPAEKRALRALHAVTGQGAGWHDCSPAMIARQLADVLGSSLELDLLCVRIGSEQGDVSDDLVYSPGTQPDDRIAIAARLLQRLEQPGQPATAVARDPESGWRLAIQRFDERAGDGGLVAASCRADFPSVDERLILSAAAQLAGCAFRSRRSERSLSRERINLQTVLDIIGDAVICTDLQGRVIRMNQEAERLTGVRADDADGRPSRDIIRLRVTTSDAPIECPLETALREGRPSAPHAEPAGLLDTDQHIHPVEYRASPVLSAEGQLSGAVLALRDISERQQADALRDRLLREAKAQGQRLIEAFRLAPSFMALLSGPDHVYELANARYYEVIGQREIIGKPVREALPEIQGQGAIELLDQVYRSGQAFVGSDMQYRLQRQTGQPAESRTFDLVFQPLHNPEGNVSGILVHGIDQTDQKRAQASLRERDARLHLLLDNAIDYAVIITDRDDRVVEWLGGAEAITGFAAENMLGQPYERLFTEEDQALGAASRTLVEASRNGRTEDRRWYRREDGALFFVDGVVVSLRGAAGELRGFGKLFRDTTAQKKAADDLAWVTAESQRRQRLYEAALSNTPDLVYVLDLAHRFVYANQALLRAWGRSWTDAIGKNLKELGYPGWQTAMQDREIAQVISSGQPVRGEAPFISSLGKRIHDYIMVPVLGAGGEVEAVAGTTRDVTDLKRSERRFSLVAAASQQINATLAIDAICQSAADQARSIIGAQRAVVRLIGDDHATPIITAVANADGSVGDTGDAERDSTDPHAPFDADPDEAALSDPSGRLVTTMNAAGGRSLGSIQLSGAADGGFTQQDEAVLAQIAAVAAIGLENARLYDSLRDSDRRKDEFLATLAHELRNPLAPLRYAIELMRNAADPAVRDEAREMVDRQVNQLVRLVDDLLDVARISTGKLGLRCQRVDLAEVVRGAVESSRPIIESAGQVLHLLLPPQPLPIDVDPARLAQVLSNLLNNAAKYGKPGGRIRLSVAQEDGRASIRVKDTGIGIPGDKLPHIFEMFSQIDTGSAHAQGGLGIGLTLVRRLVELHHGTVEAFSAGVQRGSEFIVRLPLPGDSMASPADAADGRPSIDPPRSRKILVVDDNRDAANSLAFLLSALGHETRVSYDGHAALAEAEHFQPDVAVLDLGMPVMDGFELAGRLRQLPALAEIHLIALTGWGQQQDRLRSSQAGFDHHLVKPADLAQLKRLIADGR